MRAPHCSARPIVLTVILLGLLLSAYALTDYVVGISLLWSWMLGCIGLGLGLGILGTIGMSPKPRIALLLTFALVFGAVRWVNRNSRKQFLRDLYSVRVGMARSQVDAIMGRYRTERRKDVSVYGHTTQSWGDSDCGTILFRDDRVVDVEFSPD